MKVGEELPSTHPAVLYSEFLTKERKVKHELIMNAHLRNTEGVGGTPNIPSSSHRRGSRDRSYAGPPPPSSWISLTCENQFGRSEYRRKFGHDTIKANKVQLRSRMVQDSFLSLREGSIFG